MKLKIDAPIKSFMSDNVICVSPQTVMTKVGEIFDSSTFHHVPVVENDVPVGILSKHDYYKLLDSHTLMKFDNFELKNKKWLGALTAQDVMVNDPFCLEEDDLIGNALSTFLENKIHSIIVVSAQKIVGILTPYDILRGMTLELS